MGIIHIMERGGSDLHEYKKAVKMAKAAIDTISELTEDMEEEYGVSERGGMSYRGGMRSRGGYYGRDWDEMPERRDSRGRYM